MDQLTLFDEPLAETTGATLAELAPTTGADLANTPGIFWLAFTADHDPTAARATFRRRYRREPAELRQAPGGLLLCGPVPGEVRP